MRKQKTKLEKEIETLITERNLLIQDIHKLIASKAYKNKDTEDVRIKWRKYFSNKQINSKMIDIDDKRNWSADWEINPENGKYLHKCNQCGHYFLGYKYRKVCKVCSIKNNI